MLQALKYLEAQGLIHYDVKPANILYQRKSDATYHLELTDFGLSEYCCKKVGLRGTNPYIAPEVFEPSLGQPTSRVDVWSLFVTVARHLNRKFCDEIIHLQDPKAIIEAVLSLRDDPACLRIRLVAETCPTKRPSAETVLNTLFSTHMEWQPDSTMSS